MEIGTILISGAMLLSAIMISAAVAIFASRLTAIVARVGTRTAPELFVEQIEFVPYARVSYSELQNTPWGHIPLAFSSSASGLWDVLTVRHDGEIRMRARLTVKNAGGSAPPPIVKYRCFFQGEPCGEGTHQLANPVASGESVSFTLELRLPITIPAIGVGDIVAAIGVNADARGPFLFWYDSSMNEWRQEAGGFNPAVLARVAF